MSDVYVVAWTRTLNGEKGYVGKTTSMTTWNVVATIEEAERMPLDKAERWAETIRSDYVATHAYLVPV